MMKIRSFCAAVLAVLMLAVGCTGCGGSGGGEQEIMTFAVRKDVVYQTDPAIAFDAYIPERASADKPMVILVHGGGFENGDKGQDFFVKMAGAIAETGCPAVSANYTLVRLEETPAEQARANAIAELGRLMDYLLAHADEFAFRSGKFVILGDSASGAIVINMALDIGRDRDIVGCVCMWPGMPSQTAATPWGGDVYTGVPDKRRAPELLLMHGTADSIASYDNSVRLMTLLDAVEIGYRFVPIEGAEHYAEDRADEIIPEILRFLRGLSV